MSAPNPMRLEYDLRPAFYDDFHCLASGCRLTCCKGWRITFDKKDFMAMKRQTGSPDFNARMSHALRRIRSGPFSEHFYGEIKLKEGGLCPLQSENGLCVLQLEKGHGALPWVCRIFPRQEVPSCSGYFERSLSPACEAVLALLWALPEGVDFRSDPLSGHCNLPERPRALAACFQEIRSKCIDILQDRRFSLPQRILLMGMALKSLVDGEADLSRWTARVQLLMGQATAGGMLSAEETGQMLTSFLISNIRVISSFPDISNDFPNLRQELTDALNLASDGQGKGKYMLSSEPYLNARSCFEERFAGRDYFMENLMVSLFFHLRYPALDSLEAVWKSYVTFCSMYSVYRYLSVMSCREGAAGNRDELFRLIVYGSRNMIHNGQLTSAVCESFFQNESGSLAHMAVLLSN